MGYVNRTPSLDSIINDLDDRVRALERSKRPTAVTINGVQNLPQQVQSGDFIIDQATGYLYVFMLDANTTLTSAITYTTATSYTLTVAERLGLKPGQSVRVTTTGGVAYWAQVATTHVAASGAGTVSVTFPTITVPTGWTVPPNPTTFAIGSTVIGASWRQVAFVSDLIAKGVLGPTAGAGANAALGSNTGGIGEVLGTGYKPA